MGTDIKGKDLGKGIHQKPSGAYIVRFVTRAGGRKSKTFAKLPDARRWLAEQREADENGGYKPDMTVDEWHAVWLRDICAGLSPNSPRNYRERYIRDAKPIIGHLKLTDVKPIHCRRILNAMEETGYAGSTIKQTYICLGSMFKQAMRNGLLRTHPMDGVNFTSPLRAVDDIRTMTVEEEAAFRAAALHTHNRPVYELLLKLPYLDRRSGEKRILDMADLVFLNWRTGLPTKNSSYDTHLYKICDGAGIKHISMHDLRHTYATRAAEAGVPPKVLQALLGHASITMTMDRYVHATKDAIEDGVKVFASRKTTVDNVDNSPDGTEMAPAAEEMQ